MQKILEIYHKILQKPVIYRTRLAYGLTAFFGLILFFLWFSQTSIKMKKTLELTEEEKASLKSMGRDIPSMKDIEKPEMGDLKNIFSQTQPAAPAESNQEGNQNNPNDSSQTEIKTESEATGNGLPLENR